MSLNERIIFLNKKYPNTVYAELLEKKLNIKDLIKIKEDNAELANLKGESIEKYKNEILLLSNITKDYLKENTMKTYKKYKNKK